MQLSKMSFIISLFGSFKIFTLRARKMGDFIISQMGFPFD